jgi:hypothetical protein
VPVTPALEPQARQPIDVTRFSVSNRHDRVLGNYPTDIEGTLGGRASRLLSGLVNGVPLLDPITFVGVPALLGLIGVVACAARAWRAASVAPAIALK